MQEVKVLKKMRKLKLINNIVIIISFLFVIFGLIIDFNRDLSMAGRMKILIYVTPMALLFANMLIQRRKIKNIDKRKKITNQMLFLIFGIYIIAISSLLFLGSDFRIIGGGGSINLIPFREIVGYVSSLLGGTNTIRNVLINIGGNLLAFTPMGFFIPTLFGNKIKNIGQFILLMITILFIVEGIQFLTQTGVADIDDIILNSLGALIVYMLIKVKFIEKGLKRILEKKYKNKEVLTMEDKQENKNKHWYSISKKKRKN